MVVSSLYHRCPFIVRVEFKFGAVHVDGFSISTLEDGEFVPVLTPSESLALAALPQRVQGATFNAVREAVTAEHLENPSDSEGDEAYDAAINHALHAIGKVKPSEIFACLKGTP